MSVVLPAPFGPEVAEGAAPGDEELDVVDGDVAPEALGQAVGLDGPVAPGAAGRRTVGECRGHRSAPPSWCVSGCMRRSSSPFRTLTIRDNPHRTRGRPAHGTRDDPHPGAPDPLPCAASYHATIMPHMVETGGRTDTAPAGRAGPLPPRRDARRSGLRVRDDQAAAGEGTLDRRARAPSIPCSAGSSATDWSTRTGRPATAVRRASTTASPDWGRRHSGRASSSGRRPGTRSTPCSGPSIRR